MTKPSYQEYLRQRQEEFNALPVYWAFSDEQFERIVEETGAEGPQDFARFPHGGFFLKKDKPAIDAYFQNPDPLPEYLKDYDWAFQAFLYEMGNHEYHINWQADYDVVNCFANVDYYEGEECGYLPLTGWEPQTKRAYMDAQREFCRQCDENGWW